VVEGKAGRGRGMKKWFEFVRADMTELELKKDRWCRKVNFLVKHFRATWKMNDKQLLLL